MEVNTRISQFLSKNEAVFLLELIHSSLFCEKEEDLRKIIKKLGYLVSFEFAICAAGNLDNQRKIKSYDVININYPAEWLELYITKNYHQVDPITLENWAHFKVQYWADTYKKNNPPKEFLSGAEDFGLKNGYSSGVESRNGKEGSIFTLSGDSIEHHARTEAILEHVVPHFHQALIRILNSQKRKQNTDLSPRELEVINWIKHGKSSWDISVILGISARTVKFHVSNIMHKLDVVSRPQIVAVAFEQGLIDIE